MESNLAYCGIDCAVCPAHLATATGDREALTKLAKEWGGDYPPEVATADNLRCSGCQQGAGEYLCFFCSDCTIRSCAIERELVSCAYCDEMEGCEKLEPCWKMSPEARSTILSLKEGHA